jgi:hypothetical protein
MFYENSSIEDLFNRKLWFEYESVEKNWPIAGNNAEDWHKNMNSHV